MHGSKSPLADADVDPPWHARIVGSGDRDRDRHHLRIHCAGAAARLWVSALPAATRLRGIADRRYRAFAGVDVALASASGLVSGTDGASVDIHLLGASRASDQWLRALSFSRRRRAALVERRVSKRMPFRAQRGASFLKDERIYPETNRSSHCRRSVSVGFSGRTVGRFRPSRMPASHSLCLVARKYGD